MKKTLLIALSGLSLAANAQHSVFKQQNAAPAVTAHLNSLLSAQADVNAAKTTAIRQRVKSAATYSSGGSSTAMTIDDSTSYSYTSIRGSVYDYNSFFYNDNDENGSVAYAQRIYLENWSSALTIEQKNTTHYNSAGKLDTNYYQTPDFTNTFFENDERWSYVYNAQGKLQTKYIDSWDDNLGTYTSYKKKQFFYNTAGQLIADTTYYVGIPGSTYDAANVYTYNSAGKELTKNSYIYNYSPTVGWSLNEKYTSTYYSTNYLKTHIYTYYYSGGSMSSLDSFGYGTSPNYTYYAVSYTDPLTNQYVKAGDYFRHLNSAGIPDTMLARSFNSSSIDTMKVIYKTNSYNNPDSLLAYPVIGGVTLYNAMDSKIKFRYETYDDLSVADTKKNAAIVLYPSPANNELNIQRDYSFGTRETAVIWNAAGQKVLQQSLGNDKKTTLSLGTLTPGIYWVVLHNDEGVVISRQSFIKK